MLQMRGSSSVHHIRLCAGRKFVLLLQFPQAILAFLKGFQTLFNLLASRRLKHLAEFIPSKWGRTQERSTPSLCISATVKSSTRKQARIKVSNPQRHETLQEGVNISQHHSPNTIRLEVRLREGLGTGASNQVKH